MAHAAAEEYPVRWWMPGDWNAFFGLFTNVVLNVIVLTGLTLGVVKLPGDIVFGRILPALAIALPLGNIYYAYLAYRLARSERRDTVTAMPYGPSVPHMFIVVFLIMLPVAVRTGNPVAAWQAGLAWCFVIGIIILPPPAAGAPTGPHAAPSPEARRRAADRGRGAAAGASGPASGGAAASVAPGSGPSPPRGVDVIRAGFLARIIHEPAGREAGGSCRRMPGCPSS
jgi:hypothetical protein